MGICGFARGENVRAAGAVQAETEKETEKGSEMTQGVFYHFMARIAPRWRLSASGPSPSAWRSIPNSSSSPAVSAPPSQPSPGRLSCACPVRCPSIPFASTSEPPIARPSAGPIPSTPPHNAAALLNTWGSSGSTRRRFGLPFWKGQPRFLAYDRDAGAAAGRVHRRSKGETGLPDQTAGGDSPRSANQ
jgi:hypothetical protein